MIHLSERLKRIAYYVGDSKSIADIGTDHAYLPIYIAQCGVAKKLILADINQGPLDKARENHSKYFFNDSSCEFFFRQGDGLLPVKNGEVETAIIAGMGGELIVSILSFDQEKTDSIGTFILQPRTKCDELRAWICENAYKIIAEDLALERGKICEIIVLSTKKISAKEQLSAGVYSEINISVSQLNYLLESQNPLFSEYLTQKINTEKRILDNLSKSKDRNEDAVIETKAREELSKKRIEVFLEYFKKATRL